MKVADGGGGGFGEFFPVGGVGVGGLERGEVVGFGEFFEGGFDFSRGKWE